MSAPRKRVLHYIRAASTNLTHKGSVITKEDLSKRDAFIKKQEEKEEREVTRRVSIMEGFKDPNFWH